jgi:hypothetical protein
VLKRILRAGKGAGKVQEVAIKICERESMSWDDKIERQQTSYVTEKEWAQLTESIEFTETLDSKDIHSVLTQAELTDPQFSINGEGNIWILKPACSSRGRGIKLFDSLPEILKMC